jgi:hypothetical protein
MANILTSLGIDWDMAQPPSLQITASVIYLHSYICFSLNKIYDTDVTGDVYELTMPYRSLDFIHRLLLNKLASAGLIFIFNSRIYTIDPMESRLRIQNETSPQFEFYIEFDDPLTIDELMFDSAEEALNNFRSSRGRYNPSNDFFEIGTYFKYYEHINSFHFATGNRWVNIAKCMLVIAKINRNDSIAAIIAHNIYLILSRVGASADITFIRDAKEFASGNTSNSLLHRWNLKIIDTIDSYNRIFYEI